MSKIGRRSIEIPPGVTITVQRDVSLLVVRGPKGEIRRALVQGVEVASDGKTASVSGNDGDPAGRAMHGYMRSELANMITGVATGYQRALEVNGLGYRAEVSGRTLTLHVGFTHSVKVELPAGIEAKVEKQTLVTLAGVDKALIGQTAAQIRAIRPPEPYKGRGIRYVGEQIRRKAGKAGKAAAT